MPSKLKRVAHRVFDGEIRSHRDLVRHVARLTLLVVVLADLIDVIINLVVDPTILVRSLIQTTFTAAIMSTIFIGAVARANLALYRTNQKLEHLTRTDPQTGLLNRKHFFEVLDDRWSHHASGWLILADIDRFKAINDTYGHPIGDAVIGGVAHMLSECNPHPSVVGRIGGEEFGIYLSHGTLDEAKQRAEAIRLLLATQSFGTPHRAVQARISMGIAPLTPDRTVEDTYALADRALYQAKRNGRDRVEVLEEVGRELGSLRVVRNTV
ncbi:GGDEF domain-containing protein [Faunimonas sp. B44]|uniref:GGDEF domain-containing protein n=1 Tax=Faunimonas sp. B44 TaxID=3461493 RepID=UPI00404457A0